MYCIYQTDNKKRGIIHEYLDGKISKISLNPPLLEQKTTFINKIKHYCGKKCNFYKKDFGFGDNPNGIDDYYLVYCSRCQDNFKYEPNYYYDDEREIIAKNNVILVSNFLKSYNFPIYDNSNKISKELFLNTLLDSKIYKINIPKSKIYKSNKNLLIVYIEEEIRMKILKICSLRISKLHEVIKTEELSLIILSYLRLW